MDSAVRNAKVKKPTCFVDCLLVLIARSLSFDHWYVYKHQVIKILKGEDTVMQASSMIMAILRDQSTAALLHNDLALVTFGNTGLDLPVVTLPEGVVDLPFQRYFQALYDLKNLFEDDEEIARQQAVSFLCEGQAVDVEPRMSTEELLKPFAFLTL